MFLMTWSCNGSPFRRSILMIFSFFPILVVIIILRMAVCFVSHIYVPFVFSINPPFPFTLLSKTYATRRYFLTPRAHRRCLVEAIACPLSLLPAVVAMIHANVLVTHSHSLFHSLLFVVVNPKLLISIHEGHVSSRRTYPMETDMNGHPAERLSVC
ncbi:hypothetical protein M413DRAFT_165153 [Hebeloma cylindrosporum]|uniref:Uncharacterized protein n=1 Tax=Hebeloma cylindrosporum TaxID=76867 RepID=A0A0C3BVJ4_HEBCY|nr:hypothetical protein M413DRAFT_165153 [Hebeloma cylindrosporum h7]